MDINLIIWVDDTRGKVLCFSAYPYKYIVCVTFLKNIWMDVLIEVLLKTKAVTVSRMYTETSAWCYRKWGRKPMYTSYSTHVGNELKLFSSMWILNFLISKSSVSMKSWESKLQSNISSIRTALNGKDILDKGNLFFSSILWTMHPPVLLQEFLNDALRLFIYRTA